MRAQKFFQFRSRDDATLSVSVAVTAVVSFGRRVYEVRHATCAGAGALAHRLYLGVFVVGGFAVVDVRFELLEQGFAFGDFPAGFVAALGAQPVACLDAFEPAA